MVKLKNIFSLRIAYFTKKKIETFYAWMTPLQNYCLTHCTKKVFTIQKISYWTITKNILEIKMRKSYLKKV